MQSSLLDYLRCPVSGKRLTIEVIDYYEKQYSSKTIKEIKNAILFSEAGFFFPIINGIPRMQLESVLIFSDFFKKYLPDFEKRKKALIEKYGGIISERYKMNKPTRKSFGFEWGLLKSNETKIWHNNMSEFENELFTELDEPNSLHGLLAIDIGCGHGYSSHVMANAGAIVVGLDMSLSIEVAYKECKNENIHFVQADLQFPPVQHHLFDIVYSSGVIHHTNNTELSFGIIQELVKTGGKLTVWLYQPIPSLLHNTILFARTFTRHISVRLQFWLYFFTILPIYKFYLALKGKKMSWREIMIDLLDILSPFYRYEHQPQDVECWFVKHDYSDVKITNSNLFGFSIVGKKKGF